MWPFIFSVLLSNQKHCSTDSRQLRLRLTISISSCWGHMATPRQHTRWDPSYFDYMQYGEKKFSPPQVWNNIVHEVLSNFHSILTIYKWTRLLGHSVISAEQVTWIGWVDSLKSRLWMLIQLSNRMFSTVKIASCQCPWCCSCGSSGYNGALSQIWNVSLIVNSINFFNLIVN